jgi:hypothetical protein
LKKRSHIIFSFLLLISFSWQCAAKSVIYLGFKYNQKELAATVCVNKNKPKSCCSAKCYLDKEIKKEDKRQSNSPSSIKEKAEKSELKTGICHFIFLTAEKNQSPINTKTHRLPISYESSVFHPPSL